MRLVSQVAEKHLSLLPLPPVQLDAAALRSQLTPVAAAALGVSLAFGGLWKAASKESLASRSQRGSESAIAGMSDHRTAGEAAPTVEACSHAGESVSINKDVQVGNTLTHSQSSHSSGIHLLPMHISGACARVIHPAGLLVTMQEVNNNIRSLTGLLVDLVGLRLRLAAATAHLALNQTMPWLHTRALAPSTKQTSSEGAHSAAAAGLTAEPASPATPPLHSEGPGALQLLESATPAQLKQALHAAAAAASATPIAISAAEKLHQASASTTVALDAVKASAALHRASSRSNSPAPDRRAGRRAVPRTEIAAPVLAAAGLTTGSVLAGGAEGLTSHPAPEVDLEMARFSPLAGLGFDEQMLLDAGDIQPVESDTVSSDSVELTRQPRDLTGRQGHCF
jgi:hypothetical protein